jgi:LPS-assembly protein
MSGQRVGLYGDQMVVPSYSDLLIGVSTTFKWNINLDAASEYNQNLNQVVQASITGSWRPAPRKC